MTSLSPEQKYKIKKSFNAWLEEYKALNDLHQYQASLVLRKTKTKKSHMDAKRKFSEEIKINISMLYHLLNGTRNASGRTAFNLSALTSSPVEIWFRPLSVEDKPQIIAKRREAFQAWADSAPSKAWTERDNDL